MSDDPNDQLCCRFRRRGRVRTKPDRGTHAPGPASQDTQRRLVAWASAVRLSARPERPRDPSRLRLDPVKVRGVKQNFAWYTDPETQHAVQVAKTLSDRQVATPNGGSRWNVATVRGHPPQPGLCRTAYSGRTPAPARKRKSALLPVGSLREHASTPAEDWIPIPVPVLSARNLRPAQARLAQNRQMARRNNEPMITYCGA